jgi:hypothetical protein
MSEQSTLEASQSKCPKWLLFGLGIICVASIGGLAWMFIVAVPKRLADEFLNTYRTSLLVEFNSIGFLVLGGTFVLVLIALVFSWRENRLCRHVTYSALFAFAGFAGLLALRVVAFAVFEAPHLPISVARTEQVEVYAMYLGFVGATAWFMVPVIVLGTAGAALGFWLLRPNQLARTALVFIASAVFAVAMFFLDGPATRLVGQSLWSVGVIALGCILGYAAGRVSASSAA